MIETAGGEAAVSCVLRNDTCNVAAMTCRPQSLMSRTDSSNTNFVHGAGDDLDDLQCPMQQQCSLDYACMRSPGRSWNFAAMNGTNYIRCTDRSSFART